MRRDARLARSSALAGGAKPASGDAADAAASAAVHAAVCLAVRERRRGRRHAARGLRAADSDALRGKLSRSRQHGIVLRVRDAPPAACAARARPQRDARRTSRAWRVVAAGVRVHQARDPAQRARVRLLGIVSEPQLEGGGVRRSGWRQLVGAGCARGCGAAQRRIRDGAGGGGDARVAAPAQSPLVARLRAHAGAAGPRRPPRLRHRHGAQRCVVCGQRAAQHAVPRGARRR